MSARISRVKSIARGIGYDMLREIEYEIEQLPGTTATDSLEYFDQALTIVQDLIDRQRELIAERTHRSYY